MIGVVLLAAFAALAGSMMPPYLSTSIQANTFLDSVLRSSLLPTAAPLRDFEFKVKKTALTNRQVKAKFRNGSVQKTGPVARSDDCSAPVWIGGNVTFMCSISLGTINATYEAEIKGETLLGKSKKALRASGVIPKTKAKFEATARPGFPLFIKNIFFESVDVESDFSKKISLNAERLKSLQDNFEKRVLSEVYNVLYSQYADLIKNTLQSTPFPAF